MMIRPQVLSIDSLIKQVAFKMGQVETLFNMALFVYGNTLRLDTNNFITILI